MSLRDWKPLYLFTATALATPFVPVVLAQAELVELPSYEVTALHFPELSIEVPSSITILQGSDLSSYGAVTIPEVLSNTAGIIPRSLTGTAAQASIDIRGMGITANQRVLTLVNGRALNRPDLGALNWLQILPSDVARIEIYRGGQGVIYGDNAMGGVIKIETIRPSEPGIDTTFTAGSEGLYTGSLSAETNLSGGGLRISASGLSEDGYRDHSDVSVANIAATLALQLGEWESETNFQYSRQESDLPGAVVSFGFPSDPTAAQNETDYVHEENLNFDEIIRTRLTDSLDFEFVLNLSSRAQETFFFSYTENDLYTASLTPRFKYTTGPVQWIFGADFNADHLDVDIYGDETKTSLSNEAEVDREVYAGYLHATYELSDDTSLRAGIRQQSVSISAKSQLSSSTSVDFDDSKTNELTAATVGINHRIGETFRLWARWDRLFRFPVTDEVASYQGFLLNPPFNLELRPEKGDGYELGGQVQAGDFLLSANLFLIQLEDEITFTSFFDTALGEFFSFNTNLPATERKGAELSLQYASERFRAQASWTFIDAQFTQGPNDGASPPLIPRHQVTLSAEGDLTEQISLGARAQYLSRQYEDQYLDTDFDQPFGAPNADPYIPASFVVDTYLSYAVNDRFSLQFTITNLLDRTYAPYKLTTFSFDEPDADAWYPAPGIGWRLSGRYEW